jgi:hypothetical protein
VPRATGLPTRVDLRQPRHACLPAGVPNGLELRGGDKLHRTGERRRPLLPIISLASSTRRGPKILDTALAAGLAVSAHR